MEINAPPGWIQTGVRKYTFKFKSAGGVTTEVVITRLKSTRDIVNLWVGVSSYRKRKDKKKLTTFSEGLSRLMRIKECIDEFAEFQDCDVKVIIAWADTQRKRVYSRLQRDGYVLDRFRRRLVLSKIYKYDKTAQKDRVYKSLSRYLSEKYDYNILVIEEQSEGE